MSNHVNIGDKFGEFTVVKTAKDAITRWFCLHETNNLCEAMQEGIEKTILSACLEDEYREMEEDQYIMGVGLWAYNEARRRA